MQLPAICRLYSHFTYTTTLPPATMSSGLISTEIAIANASNYLDLYPSAKMKAVARQFKVSFWKLRNRRAGRPVGSATDRTGNVRQKHPGDQNVNSRKNRTKSLRRESGDGHEEQILEIRNLFLFHIIITFGEDFDPLGIVINFLHFH